MKASKKEIRSVSNHPESPSNVNYTITQVILAFWLVLACDLLKDRCIDDSSTRFNFLNFKFEPITILCIATNQFASFCIDIRSRQCYFHVQQSGEIWNKNSFFSVYFNFYYIKQIDSMLPCGCSVIDHSNRSKCGKNISDTLSCASCARQHGIYLLNSLPYLCL